MFWIAAGLFLLGLCAGSFVNAAVWRIRQQAKNQDDLSVLTGRSQCVKCGHTLAAKDLIPIISWLSLNGRCRYCNKPISRQYPLVELLAGLTFAVSYLFWPQDLSEYGNLALFISWLMASVGLLALAVYDFKWLLLPNRILYPTFAVAAAGRLIYILNLEDLDKMQAVLDWGLAVIVASGIFWQIHLISKGRWIGYGDVRLGLVTGTLLGTPSKGFLMIFTASVLGTLYVLPTILRRKTSLETRIPFGPFLILATVLVLLFGQPIIDWYIDSVGL